MVYAKILSTGMQSPRNLAGSTLFFTLSWVIFISLIFLFYEVSLDKILVPFDPNAIGLFEGYGLSIYVILFLLKWG